jgi:hypothetical protein
VVLVSPVLTKAQLDSIHGVQALFKNTEAIASRSASARPEPRKSYVFALAAAFVACSNLAKEGEAVTYHQAFVDYVAATNTLPPMVAGLGPSSSDRQRKAAQYRRGMFGACLNRRIFITSTGAVGLGPPTTKIGHTIAVLYGHVGGLPYILRPVATHEAEDDPSIRVYQVVGHCYVHGILNGEAVQRHRLEQTEDVRFQLR